MAELNRDLRAGRRVVVFGEVLFDRFPDGREVPGGAPFNVAWNLAALGVDPMLISRVGEDERSARLVAAMVRWRMSIDGLQIDRSRPTGLVNVRLEDGEPVYDIRPDRAYDRIDEDALPARVPGAWLYHGSLASRGERSRRALDRLLREGRHRVLFDVNLRSPWWSHERVRGLLETANDVKMNEAELEILAPGSGDVQARAREVVEGYGLDRLHLTLGARGAITFSARGEPVVEEGFEGARVVDTVGAGDAFSAVLIIGRLREWPLETTIQRARQFAAGVVGLRGATTADRPFYERFTKEWGSE